MQQEIKLVFDKTYSFRYYELTVENIILCEDKIRIEYNAKNTMENRAYRKGTAFKQALYLLPFALELYQRRGVNR